MVTEIRPGVYDITTRQDDNGRRYRVFLFEEDVPTLFDTGHATTTDTLISELDDLGIEPERLVITHTDGDHVGGVDALMDRYDLELCLPELSTLDGGPRPDTRAGDGDAVGPFTAVHTPGHTEHHCAYVHEERGVAVMGDALNGADLRGLEAGQFILPPGVYSEDLVQADESLEALLAYDFDVGLVYHGSSVLEDAHAKLDRFVNFPGRP